MVTGDDVAIGSEISAQLGLGTHLLVAGDFFPKRTDPNAYPARRMLTRSNEPTDFGRVFPEHKYRSSRACSSSVISLP